MRKKERSYLKDQLNHIEEKMPFTPTFISFLQQQSATLALKVTDVMDLAKQPICSRKMRLRRLADGLGV